MSQLLQYSLGQGQMITAKLGVGQGGGMSSGTPKSDNVIYIQPRGTLFCGFFPLRGYCISSFNSLLFLIYFHKVRLNERLMLVVWELAVIMHNLRIYPKPPSLFVKMVKRMARTESMITRFRRWWYCPGVHFSFEVLPSWADQGSCAYKCVC